MRWRVTLEAVDPTGDEFRREFEFEKDLARIIHQAPAISFRRAELAGLTASF